MSNIVITLSTGLISGFISASLVKDYTTNISFIIIWGIIGLIIMVITYIGLKLTSKSEVSDDRD